jgi:type II secretory pathway pseudopilin PulG
MRSSITQKGFTLIEVLVVAPLMMMTIIIMMTYLFNLFGQLTQEGASLRLTTDAQLITLALQDDVYFANAFVSTNNAGLTDAYEPSGGWNYNTDPETLIISTPALTKNNRDPNRQPVYINTEGCEPENISANSFLYNNVIVFVSGTNLYKRILTSPTSMDTCGTSYDKQTCPENHSSTSCPKDILLSDKLDSFKVSYFDSNNTEVSTPEQAQLIKVEVQLKDRAFAEDIFGNSSITLKRLNQ